MSFFQSAPKNRRRDGGFTLNLRAETPAAERPAGRRRKSPAARLLILLGASALAWAGLAAAYTLARERWLDRIEALAVRRILITRDGVLTEAEIRRMTGVNPGRNSLTLDLYEIRQRLLRHPRVADVALRLDFPDALFVDVRERTPVARAPLPGAGAGAGAAYFLLDDQGRVMLPADPATAPPDMVEAEAALPLVTGLGAGSFSSGETLADPQSRAALQLLALLDAAPSAPSDIMNIDVGAAGVLSAVTGRGERVLFSPDDLARQVRDWTLIEQRAAGMGKAVAAVDLSVRQNIPLRWSDGGNPAPPDPRPARAKRKPARRHV